MHTLIDAARAFVLEHPDLVLFALLWIATGLVSFVPPEWRDKPVIGLLVRLVARVSMFSHATAPGTLKWPGVGDLVLNAAKDVAASRDVEPPPPTSTGGV